MNKGTDIEHELNNFSCLIYNGRHLHFDEDFSIKMDVLTKSVLVNPQIIEMNSEM